MTVVTTARITSIDDDNGVRLVITGGTVKCHVKHIQRTTCARNRSPLTSQYVRHRRSAAPEHLEERAIGCS